MAERIGPIHIYTEHCTVTKSGFNSLFFFVTVLFCCCKIAFVLSDQRPCQPNLFCCYLHVHLGSMSRHRHAKSLTGKLANTKSQLPNESGRRQRWSTCRQRSQIAKILTGSLCHSFCELIIVVGEFSLSATGPVGEFSPHTHTHTTI